MSKTYILQKDLPDSKVGDKYIWKDELPFSREAYYKNGDVGESYWTKEMVENNPEWFLQEEIEVLDVGFSHNNKEGEWYSFCVKNNFPIEKYGAIKRAVEQVLNDEQPQKEKFSELMDNITTMWSDFKNNSKE